MTTVLELDQRQSNGITVTLLWDRSSNQVSVHVLDEGADEAFEVACAPHEALNVFHHPYAYAAARGRVHSRDAGQAAVGASVPTSAPDWTRSR